MSVVGDAHETASNNDRRRSSSRSSRSSKRASSNLDEDILTDSEIEKTPPPTPHAPTHIEEETAVEAEIRNVSFVYYGDTPDLEHASAMNTSLGDFKKKTPNPREKGKTISFLIITSAVLLLQALTPPPFVFVFVFGVTESKAFWKTKCGVTAIVVTGFLFLFIIVAIGIATSIPFLILMENVPKPPPPCSSAQTMNN